ncbi:MAG: TiaS agmantine-binding domain-containing protein [Candidatus Thorarchaeota archaeon]|jgi:tRNA(Ile2)-agmatinylcytidine synthase
MTLKNITIGMDDIDSPTGGCTTHFASLLIEVLENLNVQWTDYPNLVRLNPNIPFRTRGNGAVALRFKADSSLVDDLMHTIKNMICDYVERGYPNTNPGVVLLNSPLPDSIQYFSNQTLWRTVPISLAKKLITRHNLLFYADGNQRGLVGALSAIGNKLQGDHTYEYITYRSMESSDQKRGVDRESVIEMDKKMKNRVFSNLDSESGSILIEPHGPDPVLYGIRGETAHDVIDAAALVRSQQQIERWTVFRTNQGTGAHLTHRVKIHDIRPYMSACVEGRVSSKPRIIEGGHTIFSMQDNQSLIECAAYEPTKKFRDTVGMLAPDDCVIVHAGVRPASRSHGPTLNLEGLEVVSVATVMHLRNPLCPVCEKRMKSAGKGKGFKCISCGHKDSKATKTSSPIKRTLREGIYLPPLRAQRHLTRPTSRWSNRNSGTPKSLIEKWHNP